MSDDAETDEALTADAIVDPEQLDEAGEQALISDEDGGGHAGYYRDGQMVPARAAEVVGRVERARGLSALSIQPSQTYWTTRQLAVLAARGIVQGTGRGKFTTATLQALLHQSAATGLDALTGEIIPIQSWDRQDDGTLLAKVAFIISIGILQGRAQATGQYRGMEGPEFLDEDGVWHEEWALPIHPAACRVKYHREGWTTSWTVVYWDEVVPLIPEFRESGDHRIPTGRMVEPARWRDRPVNLISKCAKAAGIRDVFADATAGFYVAEEMERMQHQSAHAEDRARDDASRVNRAEQLAHLAGVGRAGVEVVVGQVAGDDDGKAGALAEQARERITQARAAAQDTGHAEVEEQERQAWLWTELQHAAEVMGVAIETLLARQIGMWGPVESWSSRRMLSVMGPLRPAVAAAMERAGNTEQARIYRLSGPLTVSSLEDLLGLRAVATTA